MSLCPSCELPTYSPPPSVCTPHWSHECWWHYRCIVPSLVAPHRSVSVHHRPPRVSRALVLWVLTRWWQEEGNLDKVRNQVKRERVKWKQKWQHIYRCLTSSLALYCDCVPLHYCHFCSAHWSHWCSWPRLDSNINFSLSHPLIVLSLTDINSRVFWADCSPLKRQSICFIKMLRKMTALPVPCVHSSPVGCWHRLSLW